MGEEYMVGVRKWERAQEIIIRDEFDCPICEAPAGTKCTVAGTLWFWSHHDRYQLGVQAGLVQQYNKSERNLADVLNDPFDLGV